MKTVKFKEGVTIRECIGGGCYSIVKDDGKFYNLQPLEEIRFAITGDKKDYTMSFASGRIMVSVSINSDHVLIMKQILKEMGEI